MSSNGPNKPKTSSSSIDSSNQSQGPRKHPCVLCQQRKVKCDRNDPCGNCIKARVQCISPATLPARRRKKRFPEAELLARLRRYEEHLKKYGADIDAINRDGGSDGPTAIPSTIKVSPSESPIYEAVRPLSIRRSLKHIDNNLWVGMNDEFRDAEEILQGSSDDEDFVKPITRSWDAIPADGGDVIFPYQSTESLLDLHPTPIHIFRMWQTFVDSINPLTKILHAPTVQQQVLDASSNLEKISKGTEALLFSIYACAVVAMNDEECKTNFGEERSILLSRYQAGARKALIRAGFLRSSDLIILQAYVLYLLSSLHFSIDPRSLFCLSGIALRIAQRMGINFDGTTYGLPPFEIEMRRRLWWQIILLDNRVGELSGSGCTIFTHSWTTRLPLNVNDSDLFPDMRDPPVEHSGVTEMIYVLQRCESIEFLRRMKDVPASDTALTDKAALEFEEVLEKKYLNRCDPQVPLHLISTLMARSGICKLRMGRRRPHLMASGASISNEDRDKLFLLSLRMLENHNIMMGNPALKRFLWHIYTNFPFPAHVYLLCVLRYRTTDELADRAWEVFAESFDRRINHQFAKRSHSALHLALANLTVKAWEAREAALQLFQPAAPTPRFISYFRQKLKSKKSKTVMPAAESTTGRPTDVGLGDQIMDSNQWLNQNNILLDSTQMFDQSLMPGLMASDSSMEWGFWNDFMQGSGVPQIFDGSISNQYFQG